MRSQTLGTHLKVSCGLYLFYSSIFKFMTLFFFINQHLVSHCVRMHVGHQSKGRRLVQGQFRLITGSRNEKKYRIGSRNQIRIQRCCLNLVFAEIMLFLKFAKSVHPPWTSLPPPPPSVRFVRS